VEELRNVLQRIKLNESTILLGDFNAHVGHDTEMWKGVIDHHGDSEVNDKARQARRPNFAAGGQKTTRGPHFLLQYRIYATSGGQT